MANISSAAAAQKVYILHKKPSLSGTLCAKPNIFRSCGLHWPIYSSRCPRNCARAPMPSFCSPKPTTRSATSAVMGLLVNPANPNAELDTQEAQNAAHKLGLELHGVGASNAQEIDTAFATLVQQRAHALVIDGDTLFSNRRQQLTALTAHHRMPAIYAFREFPDAGGLMSYGASNVDADRLGRIYVGRI